MQKKRIDLKIKNHKSSEAIAQCNVLRLNTHYWGKMIEGIEEFCACMCHVCVAIFRWSFRAEEQLPL